MTTAGPRNPTSTGDDATIGDTAWSNTANAVAADSSYATAVLAGQYSASHYLYTYGFGFSIPSTATINGIVVEAKLRASTASVVLDNGVNLYQGGFAGSDRSNATYWPTSDASYKSWGGASDLWGYSSWTPAQINAASFGVGICGKNFDTVSRTISIDHIRITVYYTDNTAPTITAGPTTTYATLTRTGPSNTWGLTFTAHDPEQTGAGALTYYVYTGAARTGSQIATGTCTSDSSKVITGLAYNIAGLADGSNTLYLSVYDGAAYSADSSFVLLRDDTAPTAATSISTTPSPVV